jgi:hypothetical protein
MSAPQGSFLVRIIFNNLSNAVEEGMGVFGRAAPAQIPPILPGIAQLYTFEGNE